MTESGFYLWPTNKLYKKEKTHQLKNFPAGYVGSFYKNLSDNVDNFLGSDFYSRITADAEYLRKMFKNIFWWLPTLQKAFRLILIIMSRKIELMMQVLDRN